MRRRFFGSRRFFGTVLRALIVATCLVAVVLVPLPRIECRCGADLPHEHSALGFSPHHRYGQTTVTRSIDPVADAELKADSDLRVMTGLPLLAEFPGMLVVGHRSRVRPGETIDHPVGVQQDPESPPPRSSPEAAW